MGRHEDPEHAHGHDQDHDHGGPRPRARTGVLGWFKHTFAHSHDVHEKVDDAMETNERGIWALKISLARPRRDGPLPGRDRPLLRLDGAAGRHHSQLR